MVGTVKWFNEIKGYGFVNTAESEVFVHISQLAERVKAQRTLFPGDEVEFEVLDTPKGPRAQAVKVVKRMPRREAIVSKLCS